MNAKELRPVATLMDAQGNNVTPLPWEEARARIDAARWYWLTTLHPSGRPHTRPVLAVWTNGALCTTSSRSAQKGRNLRRDPRCSVAILADDMHIVLEGTASASSTRIGPLQTRWRLPKKRPDLDHMDWLRSKSKKRNGDTLAGI